jgi:hypothetical protein
MSRWPLWAVLTPGEPSRLGRRVCAALMFEEDEEDEDAPSFEVIPSRGRYHAIVGTEPGDVGVEIQIAKAASPAADAPPAEGEPLDSQKSYSCVGPSCLVPVLVIVFILTSV